MRGPDARDPPGRSAHPGAAALYRNRPAPGERLHHARETLRSLPAGRRVPGRSPDRPARARAPVTRRARALSDATVTSLVIALAAAASWAPRADAQAFEGQIGHFFE